MPLVHLLLGSETRPDRPDLSQIRCHHLEVELTRLSHVPPLSEEIYLEHRRHIFARPGRSCNVRNRDFDEGILLKVLPGSGEERRLDSSDRLQARVSKDSVPRGRMLHVFEKKSTSRCSF